MEPVTTNSDLPEMQSQSETTSTTSVSTNTSQTPQPIAEFAARPDFPECVRGHFVDIGGYAGLVVDIAGNSLKVRSPGERTRSFNFHTLRKLYGPRVELEPMPTMAAVTAAEAKEPEPQRNVITEPDFNAPLKPITDFTGRRDFPKCALGAHVDIGGYHGVVVEIVNRSLKVRSVQETTKSYNADALKKLYPGTTQA